MIRMAAAHEPPRWWRLRTPALSTASSELIAQRAAGFVTLPGAGGACTRNVFGAGGGAAWGGHAMADHLHVPPRNLEEAGGLAVGST